jgi:hypothetical protein
MNTNIIYCDPPIRRKISYWCLCCILTTGLLCSAGEMAQGQLVNGDFELNCGSSTWEAFQTAGGACVTGSWFVSHGTPDIQYNIGGNATATAHMWSATSSELTGEGLFIECPNFESGVTYRLSLDYYAANNPDDVYISLTNGLTHNTSITDWSFPSVSESILHHIVSPVNTTWTTLTFTFTPSANYSQLWIYLKESSNVHSYLNIDNVVVKESCPANAVYSGFAGTPMLTEVADYIEASGTSTVSSGQTITYRAGNYIQLLPDFHADPGSGFFHAYITPCEGFDIAPCDDNGIMPKGGSSSDNSRLYDQYITSVNNYPNPFTGKTTINYTLAENGPVTLVITDMLGEQVAELVRSSQYGAGQYSMEFDGSALSPGVYFLTLQSGTTSTTRKMVVTP